MEASELRYKDILDAARVLNRLQERARSNAQSPHRQSVRRTCENRAPGRRRPRTRASSSPGPWQSGAVLERPPGPKPNARPAPGKSWAIICRGQALKNRTRPASTSGRWRNPPSDHAGACSPGNPRSKASPSGNGRRQGRPVRQDITTRRSRTSTVKSKVAAVSLAG